MKEAPQVAEIVNLAVTMAPVAVPFLMAFSKSVRKQIGRRDKWTCQIDSCNKRFQDGWFVQAAHYPETHQKTHPLYNDPSSGVILCIDHHQEQHEQGTSLGPKGDARAVQLLRETDRRTRDWRKNN